MTEEQLKVGDVVRLKSGGPAMTVGTITSLGSVEYHWFEGTEHKFGLFNPEVLQKSEP